MSQNIWNTGAEAKTKWKKNIGCKNSGGTWKLTYDYWKLDAYPVPYQDILFEYNTQHDCRLAGCSATGKRPIVQEWVQSNITETYIEHKPLDIFLINTHAFHNAHLIRAILPRDLIAPLPYLVDQQSLHDEVAEKLRTTQNSKRAAVAAKATEKKKAAATAAESKERSVDNDNSAGSGHQKRQWVDNDIANGGLSSLIPTKNHIAACDMG